MVMRQIGWMSAAAMLVLTACETPQKRSKVWELYDVRYPVPAGSAVPVSRASVYDRYTDNDEFYTPPTFGTCGSTNIGIGGCE